jgi:hypothetical protein
MSNECYHFVLTSYEKWVFGAFTDCKVFTTAFFPKFSSHTVDYTAARVSPVIARDAQEKTPLEYLTYWMLSSVYAPDTKAVPQVSVSVQKDYDRTDEAVCSVHHLMEVFPDVMSALKHVT